MAASLAHRQILPRMARGPGPARFQPAWEPIVDPYTEELPWRLTPVFPRIPRRYQSALAGTALTIALTGIVSFGTTLRSVGLSPELFDVWFTTWQFAILIAVPARFLLAPPIAKGAALISEPAAREL